MVYVIKETFDIAFYNPVTFGDEIEFIISNNDGMAQGAIAALQAAGYNKGDDSKFIPVVGVDATDAAKELIKKSKSKSFICNDQEIIISTTVCLNDKYYLKDQDNIILIIEYEINYYYYLENDKLGVVSYLKRSETVTLNKDNLNQEIKLTLNPVNEIPDFKYFKNVEVNYTIIEYDGIVYN